ncbi:MAG: acyl-CoA thioesterase [Beijerinckiaceae bacterium]
MTSNTTRKLDRQGPEARAAFAHFYAIAQRWIDSDAYRHMNNAVYYSFFDTAVNRYLIEQGALDVEKSPQVGLVVETQCRFFCPIVFPSMVNVGMRVDHIGTSSLRYAIALFADEAEIAAAQGTFVHVYVDRSSNRPVPIPDAVKAAVLPLLRPRRANPASA